MSNEGTQLKNEVMVKIIVAILVIAVQSTTFGAAVKQKPWTPQAGYWYNNTNSAITVRRINAKDMSRLEQSVIQPRELVKMTPFQESEYFSVPFGGDRWVEIYAFKKDEIPVFKISMNREFLKNFGSEYVIVFDPSPKNNFFYSIMPEKEVRELFAKEIEESYPVPSGVRGIISGYVFPTSEKAKCNQE